MESDVLEEYQRLAEGVDYLLKFQAKPSHGAARLEAAARLREAVEAGRRELEVLNASD